MEDKDILILALKAACKGRGIVIDKLIDESMTKDKENLALRLKIETLEGIIERYQRLEESRNRFFRFLVSEKPV